MQGLLFLTQTLITLEYIVTRMMFCTITGYQLITIEVQEHTLLPGIKLKKELIVGFDGQDGNIPMLTQSALDLMRSTGIANQK